MTYTWESNRRYMGSQPVKCPWPDITYQLADCYLLKLDIAQEF